MHAHNRPLLTSHTRHQQLVDEHNTIDVVIYKHMRTIIWKDDYNTSIYVKKKKKKKNTTTTHMLTDVYTMAQRMNDANA